MSSCFVVPEYVVSVGIAGCFDIQLFYRTLNYICYFVDITSNGRISSALSAAVIDHGLYRYRPSKLKYA